MKPSFLEGCKTFFQRQEILLCLIGNYCTFCFGLKFVEKCS